MGNLEQPAPPRIERCEACFIEIGNVDIYCAGCGYPLKGTALEQKAFIAKQNKRDIAIAAAKKDIKESVSNAGDTLYYLAGFSLFIAILDFLLLTDNPAVLAIVVPKIILAVLFLLLGEYSKKKMLAAFVSGLCLLVIVEILDIIADPKRIGFVNILVVTIVIVYLVRGIKSAIEIEKTKKEKQVG